jgi:hypothetical protein
VFPLTGRALLIVRHRNRFSAKAPVDGRDNLVVPADRSKELGGVIRHLLRHFAPPPLPGQCGELVAEILEPVHCKHRVIGRRRAIESHALAHPFEAACDRLVIRSASVSLNPVRHIYSRQRQAGLLF